LANVEKELMCKVHCRGVKNLTALLDSDNVLDTSANKSVGCTGGEACGNEDKLEFILAHLEKTM
jgi:hypothetical protein